MTTLIKQRRLSQFWIAVSILLSLLGTGNYVFGSLKKHDYVRMLNRAERELEKSSHLYKKNVLLPGINLNQQTQLISRLKSRVEFYHLVSRVGSGFILAGVVKIQIHATPTTTLPSKSHNGRIIFR